MNAAQRAQVDEQAANVAAQVAEKREQEAGKMARQQQREREGQQRAVEVTRVSMYLVFFTLSGLSHSYSHTHTL